MPHATTASPPAATWTETSHDGPSAWSVDLGSGLSSAVVKTSAGAARAVRGGLPYLDCALQAQALPSAVDTLMVACFDGCTNPLSFQECIIRCSAGGNVLDGLRATSAASCVTDPGAGCAAYRAPLAAWCAALPNPPPYCLEQCFGDPTCEGTCVASANCAFVVQRAGESCTAANR